MANFYACNNTTYPVLLAFKSKCLQLQWQYIHQPVCSNSSTSADTKCHFNFPILKRFLLFGPNVACNAEFKYKIYPFMKSEQFLHCIQPVYKTN